MQYYVNENELMNFTYNGVSSTSFFMVIEEIEGLLDTFERDIELIEIKGRDGELVIDNQRKKSKNITITGQIDVEKSNKRQVFKFYRYETNNNKNPAYGLNDIGEDYKVWPNSSIAKYYGIKGIKTKTY